MSLDKFNRCWKGREVWVVADGATCPKLTSEEAAERQAVVIAVNYGWRNYSGKPWAIVYQDRTIARSHATEKLALSELADVIFHGETAPTMVGDNCYQFRMVERITNRFQDGVYGRGNSGALALSIALLCDAAKIRLFGFDCRVFSERESLALFGAVLRAHKSESPHRFDGLENNALFAKKSALFAAYVPYAKRIVNHSLYSNIPYFERLPWPCEF